MKNMRKDLHFLAFTLIFTVLTAFSVSAEHKHTYEVLYKAKPTCTEKGYTVFSCSCGKSYSGDTVNAYGHNYSKEVVCFKKATCTQKGEGGRYCLRCYAKTDKIYYKKTLHKSETVIKKATVKRNGEVRKECSVCKKLYSSKIISKISTVRLEKKTYTYDGKIKTPSVTVKDAKGKSLTKDKDYTLKYQKGRKKTGKYCVTVTFKGNYEGVKKLYFSVSPAPVKNIEVTPSVSSVYFSWDKSKGADGYEIYLNSNKLRLVKDTENSYCTVSKIDGKKLKSGQDYTFVIKGYKKSGDEKIYSSSKKIKLSLKPDKAQIKKLSYSSGKVSVTPVKQSCHGYEVLISTNKSFSNAKSVKIKVKDAKALTIGNLSGRKTYYIKIRAYVVSGGKKYCGYYSDVKSIKI